jgi:hypothetical protein
MGEDEYEQSLLVQSDSSYNKAVLRVQYIGTDDNIDDLIIKYMSNGCNQGICSYDRLRLYFCYKLLLSRLRLLKRLESLVKHKIIKKDKFYTILYYEVV